MATHAPPEGTDWVKLTFSAKEAVYKCIAPQVGRWVGFREVALDFLLDRQEFLVRPGEKPELEGVRLDRITGRYRVEGGLVISTAVLPAE